jgi:hypothetical protein
VVIQRYTCASVLPVYVGTCVAHMCHCAEVVQGYTCAGVVQGNTGPEIVCSTWEQGSYSRKRLQDKFRCTRVQEKFRRTRMQK